MLKTYLVLAEELKNYVNPAAKLARMVKAGEIIRIKQGLYETDPHAEGVGIAEAIYGPSYLSFSVSGRHRNDQSLRESRDRESQRTHKTREQQENRLTVEDPTVHSSSQQLLEYHSQRTADRDQNTDFTVRYSPVK